MAHGRAVTLAALLFAGTSRLSVTASAVCSLAQALCDCSE